MTHYPAAADLVGHPFANAFPMIEGRERIGFRADIEKHGIREPVVLYDGQVLDGRNRLREGLQLGLIAPDANPLSDPHFRLFGSRPGDGADPREFVISLNLDGRRHLSESQRALVAAQFETLGHGGKREQDANLQPTRTDLAGRFNVSARSVASARKVIDNGASELVAKVEQGELPVSVAEKLARLPREDQATIIANVQSDRLKIAAKQAMREATEKRLANKQKALPTAQFGVIYADPAWQFQPYSRETGLEKAADNHYPTQPTDDIKKLPVGTIAASDCVLFLWATAPMLCDAMSVMRFWGFEYKTHFIWDKVHIAPGYWNRNRHELLLIGTRGQVPAPAPGTQFDSIIVETARGHSVKPDRAYEIIEAHYPNLPKIELNARIARPGWVAWGKEAPDPRAEFEALVAASTVDKGSYTQATAEPIMRAAYACDPVVPTKELAGALGHPVGTVLTWASRLELTKAERRGGPAGIGRKATGGGR